MARMIEYLNPKPHAIQIASPEKKIIKIRATEKITLSDWYMRYCPKYLRVVRVIEDTPTVQPKDIKNSSYVPERLKRSEILEAKKQKLKQAKAGGRTRATPDAQRPRKSSASPSPQVPARLAQNVSRRRQKNPVVGRRARESGAKLFNQACQNNKYLISSNVGVGILSFNRLKPLQRLINSIRKHTDLRRVTVFVSDESTKPEVKNWLKKQTDIVVLTDQPRLGVAGNTNRLMQCLSRFKHALILNDDVEILRQGWENFYPRAHKQTGFHHFCYHQVGVYGAKRGKSRQHAPGWSIETITEKPHGGVLYYTNEMFQKIGYFDESFGPYGMEHVDWSERAGKCGLQAPGFHDVMTSEKYFKIHKEKSVVPNRGVDLNLARKKYKQVQNQKNRIYIDADPKVPSISVVIPIRNLGRQEAIESVVNSIRGQLFPNVEIILAEQDEKTNVALANTQPCQYYLAKSKYPNQPFTKAMAFNLGVAKAAHDKVILQDADIVVPSHYAEKIYKLLNNHGGVHIGSRVLYMSKDSSNSINKTGTITPQHKCDRAVEYFEGGSLACTKKAYFGVGGFNDIFEGYGVEDCDFFWRLKDFAGSFFNTRTEDFVHLWHGRTGGWEAHHRKNKRIAEQINRRYKPSNYVASLVTKMKRQYPAVLKELGL